MKRKKALRKAKEFLTWREDFIGKRVTNWTWILFLAIFAYIFIIFAAPQFAYATILVILVLMFIGLYFTYFK